LVFARSRRTSLALTAFGTGLTAAFGVATVVAARRAPEAAFVLLSAAVFGLVLAVASVPGLIATACDRLGLFRDRLVVISGRTELHARWEDLESATLTVPLSPMVTSRLVAGDGLMLIFRRGGGQARRVLIRPRGFGMDLERCRDLVLSLRDDAAARSRLPEFDSVLDLIPGPRTSRDLSAPRI
jgi:hypothetical protein